MHFFTSIAANYLPKARVLANSIKKHNPGIVFHLVLLDKVPEGFFIDDEPFDSLILPKDLGISDIDSWTFKHSVVELCTAIKGHAFIKIFEATGADKLVYFDPDIVVLSNLEELSNILNMSSIVLIPHQVVPDDDDGAIVDNEICSLKHGIYNLGFLAIKKNREGMKFLHWWRDRLLKFCYDDIPNGLFTDQRWVDLAPAFFDDIFILRDKTYNVATWNLTHRDVRSQDNGVLSIEGSPVKFFHFSGFDSGDQEVMLKKYADKNSALFKLRKWYVRELDRQGQKELGRTPSQYSFYSNGELITNAHRILYRSRNDLIEAFPYPAVVTENEPCYFYWLKNTYPIQFFGKDQIISASEEQLMEVLNSRSWKLTLPLRLLAKFIRKCRSAVQHFL